MHNKNYAGKCQVTLKYQKKEQDGINEQGGNFNEIWLSSRIEWTSRVDFFWNSNKGAGEKLLKRRTISDNFGSEKTLCTVWDDMYSLLCNNKTFSQCSISMCLFMENQINEQKGQNPKINKQAGENKSEYSGSKCWKLIDEHALLFDTWE